MNLVVTEFDPVSSSFIESYLVVTQFYWILPSFSFFLFLLSLHWNEWGCTGLSSFTWSLLGLTEFFTWFYLILLDYT